MFRSFVCLFLIAASFVALPRTWAEDSREAVFAYKYRDTVMQAIGGHMGAVTVIMRAKSHQDDLALHAKSIADLAKLVPAIFRPVAPSRNQKPCPRSGRSRIASAKPSNV